uniref:Alpha-taxilin n=1 Tax=Aegilops tauschii TaxID=37682 RepID=M8BGT0_AEGTA
MGDSGSPCRNPLWCHIGGPGSPLSITIVLLEDGNPLMEAFKSVVQEECQRVSTEGQNFRMEMSDKFENAMKAVSVKLEEQKNECIAQFEENNSLRNKLKDLADQYNIIQQKYAHQLKEKTLELELADLKIQQHQAKAAQEHAQMVLYAEQVSQLVTTEKNLRVQLAADGEKFQQFQDALSKSNEVFETYKKEMEQMVKAIKDFRKQNEALKNKCENSDIALVKLIEEREVMKKQLDKYKNQKDKLESLCRSLQAERKQSPSVSIPNDASNQEDVTSQKQSPSSSIPDDASNQEDVTSQQPEIKQIRPSQVASDALFARSPPFSTHAFLKGAERRGLAGTAKLTKLTYVRNQIIE